MKWERTRPPFAFLLFSCASYEYVITDRQGAFFSHTPRGRGGVHLCYTGFACGTTTSWCVIYPPSISKHVSSRTHHHPSVPESESIRPHKFPSPKPHHPNTQSDIDHVRSSSSSATAWTIFFLARSSSLVFHVSRRDMLSYSANTLVNASWSPSSAASASPRSSLHSRLSPKDGSTSSYLSSAFFTPMASCQHRRHTPALSRYPFTLNLSKLLCMDALATSSYTSTARG
mmetsp:Transcript_4012/g.9736  ORF Transcript_4012/g.9736 Transcript_4012/m.9736 type:complete len:229 (+) Transcript_4012:104-790(+)